ncbi:dihydrolipoamide succinyltransferase, partial [Achromobacter ruhlandii]|nr:dihydrolipoamide succinyltransferase [Achromobacter ruhlandii]
MTAGRLAVLAATCAGAWLAAAPAAWPPASPPAVPAPRTYQIAAAPL